MLNTQQEIFSGIELISIFFILLVAIIIITAILYHNRKRAHEIDIANFNNLLLQSQLEVQEQTMQTIGADLHDNIGQLLSLTSLTLNSIEPDDIDKTRQKVSSAIDLTSKSIKEMRHLGKLLQGDQLIIAGLPEAIRQEINWVEKTGKYEFSYIQEGQIPEKINSDKDLIVFRILQEILNNIIKHANASAVTIQLKYGNQFLQLQTYDNGKGFDPASLTRDQKGMGLHNINRRAEIIGGQVEIQSQASKGTTITMFIPYP